MNIGRTPAMGDPHPVMIFPSAAVSSTTLKAAQPYRGRYSVSSLMVVVSMIIPSLWERVHP
jgi:hypothetical protein